MSDRDEHAAAGADNPHRTNQQFLHYYVGRHEAAPLIAKFESDKHKVTAFLARRAGNPARTILDVGCGPGTQAMIWAADGYEVSALDINEALVDFARHRAEEKGLKIDFRLGSATALPWADNTFDVCLIPELLEHVPDWQAVLSEAIRVLKPDGVFYLSTTNALCPRQEEFDLPCYSWYPKWLKRHYERLATTTRPELVSHATYPAVNWFTPYGLARVLRRQGVETFDRFDLLDVDTDSRIKKLVSTVCSALPPVRLIAHICTPATTMLDIKTAA